MSLWRCHGSGDEISDFLYQQCGDMSINIRFGKRTFFKRLFVGSAQFRRFSHERFGKLWAVLDKWQKLHIMAVNSGPVTCLCGGQAVGG